MAIALVIGLSSSGSGPHPELEQAVAARSVLSPEVQPPPGVSRCRSARGAVAYYRARTWERQTWREARHATRSPIARGKSCYWVRYAVDVWRARARAARLALREWFSYHYRWELWLPANWLAVAICESGHNPPNWAHDSGTYVSAFGIYRPGYVDDAHRIGALSWDETIDRLGRFPTPREQYEAALSHYRTHGDGWGCAGP